MMDMQTITEEIARLEGYKPSYEVCKKLADLYIVKDHLMGGGQGTSYMNYARGGNTGARNYTNYGYDYGMMEDEMGMNRSPRMSMPSMR